MNSEPEKNIRENMKNAAGSWLREAPRRLFKIAVHNWPWKLLAVFLAVCLWAGLITQDPTLTRERVFTDVPLGVTGEETLRRNGMIVLSGLEEENMNVRMRVEVPQREYNTVAYTNYNPRVELARITEPGEQQVKIASTSTTAYGSVMDMSPDALTVVVDEYVTNYRVPVSVNVTGEYPDGFYGGVFSLDPAIAALSGPKTLVDQVARIYVDYDASALKAEAGDISTALPMRFVDRQGNEVVSDLLEVTSSGVVLRSIIVDQTLYPIRLLPVSTAGLVTGEPARGYQITEISVSPSVLRAAGDETILNDLESLFVDVAVDVEGITESTTATVRIKKPTELVYLNSTTGNVTVTVEPVVISSSFASLKLNVRGIGSGLRAGTDVSSISAVVTGPQLQVEVLRAADVSPYVDVTGLAPGEYVLPIQFHVEDKDAQDLSFEATPATVTVTVFEN